MEQFDIIIVGSGPAGSSTALHLLQRDAAWAGRILILEKAHHPRHKLCGGGLTEWGARPLASLGLRPPVPHVMIDHARFAFEGRTVSVRRPGVFRIYRRDEFDEWLCAEVQARDVQVRQGEAVTDVQAAPGGIVLSTAQGQYCAKVLVGADGSKSVVRRKLRLAARAKYPGAGAGGVARLLEVLTPEDAATTPEFTEGSAVFDFTPLASGVQGYYWDFPSLVKGRPFMNRGVFDSRADGARPRAALKSVLGEQLARRGRDLDAVELQGHPIHWFDPGAQFARPHAILVGDAAGVDPLFGEGIGYALHYGRVAARAIEAAFAAQDFSFGDYRRRVLLDWVGRDLLLRAASAGLGYRLFTSRAGARAVMGVLRAVVPLIPWANQPATRRANLDTKAVPR